MRFMVSFEETRSGGEAVSDEEWSDRRTAYCEHSILSVSLNASGPNVVSVSVQDKPDLELLAETEDPWRVGMKIHLVEVTYGNGDTFGHSSGNWEVMGIYKTRWQAAEAQRAILYCSAHPDGRHDDRCWEGSRPWEGYFECFEGVNIQEFILEEGT